MDSLESKKKEDKELVADYLAGYDEFLPIIINRYIKSVYRFVFALVGNEAAAEDITQEVFVKIWKNFKKYNNKYSFKTWLFSIARNTAFDYLRKKKEIVFSEFENASGDNILEDTLADEAPLPDEAMSKMEDIKVFTDALKEIPVLYREVLILRYTNDLTIEEIAKVFKRPIETVKSQHRRGIMHLKEILLRIK